MIVLINESGEDTVECKFIVQLSMHGPNVNRKFSKFEKRNKQTLRQTWWMWDRAVSTNCM